jgi:predicted phage terminase large subunit-like protein
MARQVQTKVTDFTSKHVANFVTKYLLAKYDDPAPIPAFHREMWDLALSGARRVAIVAPRYHAKSTAITHALTLFLFLFRIKKYGLIVSDTEAQAILFLGDIKAELQENEELRADFGIREVTKDAATDIIVECEDGHKFRIQALGAEQKVRGRKWEAMRPDYIVVDDLENDELVESDSRREKLRNWFLKALVPCVSKKGTIVMVGTILHLDALLNRLLSNDSWLKPPNTKYAAHKGFDDFTEILWPEHWSVEALMAKRQEYIDDGFAEGYAQEYLNDPIAHSDIFFDKKDFLPMEEGHHKLHKSYYAGVDLAISEEDKRAYTVIVVGGMDQFGVLHIVKVIRFRGDSYDIINTMLDVQKVYGIELWKVEEGQIKKTLMGEMYRRMQDTGVYMNVVPAVPSKDKKSRARACQSRIRAGGVRFDKEADWYATFELECIQFPKGTYKDQVDAFAWLCTAINELSEGPTEREVWEELYEEQLHEYEDDVDDGRSPITGY